MRELFDVTMNQACDFLAHNIAKEREITVSMARKLVANAVLYNVVIEEINDQIDFLLEEE